MPVSVAMIKELTDAFLKDLAYVPSFRKEFRRLGEVGQRNNAAAAAKSASIHQASYEGHELSHLLQESSRVYGQGKITKIF